MTDGTLGVLQAALRRSGTDNRSSEACRIRVASDPERVEMQPERRSECGQKTST